LWIWPVDSSPSLLLNGAPPGSMQSEDGGLLNYGAVIMSQIHSELNVHLKKSAREPLCLLVGEREFFTIIV
jgi:hypothetical protein